MATHLSAASPVSPSARSRPGTGFSYGGFTLPSSPSSSSSPSSLPDPDRPGSPTDGAPLPFPSALARADFLAPDFDAVTYLSRLHGGVGAEDADGGSAGGAAGARITGAPRYQTLEDLRAELRERSAAISAELLELVNANYTSFLGLGDELQGGGERVEDVRVGLLGFRRAVLDVKARAAERRAEVGQMCDELQDARDGIERGRRMLELDERVAGLEERLLVGSLGHGKAAQAEEDGWDALEDSDDEDDDEVDEEEGATGFVGTRPSKLASLAREYRMVEQLADSIGRGLPFVRRMEERMSRCRNTILLDLGNAVKETRKAGLRGQGRVMAYLAIYRVLDAQAEAVRALKEQ